MIQCRMMLAVGLAWLVVGCGSADQRGIEQAVAERLGPTTKVIGIGDPIFYRTGDDKRVCVVVEYENSWGETMTPLAIYGRYHFGMEKWFMGDASDVDESFDCRDRLTERGANILN